MHDATVQVEPVTSASSTRTFLCLRTMCRIGGRDLAGGEHAGRYLVKEGLEQVVVSPVDERDVDRLGAPAT